MIDKIKKFTLEELGVKRTEYVWVALLIAVVAYIVFINLDDFIEFGHKIVNWLLPM